MNITAINIDEIKRFPTVTNPIKADDLHTPQAYAYTLRRAIVIGYTDDQRADLLEITKGREATEGITFANTKQTRDRLHGWQNKEAQKERAAILGDGWKYIEGLNSGTESGDLITCIDGTQGRVTKSDPESCVIEFETADGNRYSVAGYFRKERTTLQDTREITESEKAFNEAMTIKVGDRVLSKKYGVLGTVTVIRTERCDTIYDVKFDKPVKSFWTNEETNTMYFSRYAITKNYDGEGCEVKGSAVYYAEELQADYWLANQRTIFDIEIYKPTEHRPSWLVVDDIFTKPKQATLFEVCDYLAALYQEKHKAA